MIHKTHIVTISDTHGLHREIDIPEGDIIIHAGDFSNIGTKQGIEDFVDWYGSLPHSWKILIAGNHDKGTDPDRTEKCYKYLDGYFITLCALRGIVILNDSDYTIDTDNGESIKIWGSPVQPTFGYGWAWNRNRGADIQKHWDKIPNDADIVVTHGPAFGYGDRVIYGNKRVGCDDLLKALVRAKPKMHIFGHIHGDRGVFMDTTNSTTFVNTSSLTLQYRPYIGKTFRFEWNRVVKNKSHGYDYE